MREHDPLTDELARNGTVFRRLLGGRPPEVYRWHRDPEAWSLLDIVCHLYDEEREDFRARVRHSLENPDLPAPAIDPVGWVTARDYAGQDYEAKLAAFLRERDQSVAWLRSLESAPWEQCSPHLRGVSAFGFLANWVAHDALHVRQIVRHGYDRLQRETGQDLGYAGTW